MWDKRYSEEGFAYGKEPNYFLKSVFSKLAKGSKVLCLAEGEGRNAVYLAKQGYKVSAIDQSLVGLKKAQSLAKENGVEISTIVANLADYDLGTDVWDGVISIAAHMPLPIRKSLHKRVVEALKSNGMFILEAYTTKHLGMEGIGGPPDSQKEMLMSLAELKLELKGLDFEIGEEIERFVNEGKYHQGNSAVVQVLAYKRD